MKDRNPPASHEPIALVVQIPPDDHRIYVEARRILRCLMGRRTPSLETLVVHDLQGRDATGIVDNYLDALRWPLERGRAITVKMREQAAREDTSARRSRRRILKLARPPADPARN